MTAFEQLFGPAELARLAALLLVYVRVQAFMTVLPGFSARFLPVRLRVALALAVTPLLAGPATFAGSEAVFIGQLAAEAVTGVTFGGLVRLMAMALDTAATAIAQAASLSQIIGVTDEHSPHPVGNLMHLAGLAVLMAMGFPLMVCDLLADSFRLRPVGSWLSIEALWPVALTVIPDGFLLALTIASPFVLGGFLFQALSGVVARVMPALPVTFIAAPAAVLLALLALVALTPMVLSHWADAVLGLTLPELP